MPNIKEINWDVIRADYVMDASYPSYDELCRKYGISKPLLIEKANDRNDVINQGFTWIEQREKFTKKKQSVAEDVAITQAKKHINNYIKILNNIGFKSFTILTRELDWIEKQQKKAEEEMCYHTCPFCLSNNNNLLFSYLKSYFLSALAVACYPKSKVSGFNNMFHVDVPKS